MTSAGSQGSSTTTVSTVDVDGGGHRLFRDDSWEFPVCRDLPELAAPPEAYQNGPPHVPDQTAKAEVEAWAESQPAYEGIWTDRDDHDGWISVAFSRAAEARQRDLEEEFPDVRAVAVPVERTRAELEALAGRVGTELRPFLAERDWVSIGPSVHKGVAHLKVGVLTAELRSAIDKGFTGAPLCVEGTDPASVPAAGPQPEGGDGWRLLADEDGGLGNRWPIGLAADAASYTGLWAGWDSPVPEVDFQDYVVIGFVADHPSSCPEIRLDDVTVAGDIVYPEIVNLAAGRICTSDAVPHAYVVALERSRLPSGPFVIQIAAELPWRDRLTGRLIVNTDLSAPGAVPDPGAVRDGTLTPALRSGADGVEPGVISAYRFDPRCGIEWLGEVNGVAWRTDEPMPEKWESAVEPYGVIEVTIMVRAEPEPLIEAGVNGETITYKPADEEMPKCDHP